MYIDQLIKMKNPENDKKQAVAKRTSDSDPVLVASSTILASNSTDTGVIFVTGLANILCNPCKAVWTNGHDVWEGRPDVEWTHTSALQASLTAAFDLKVSPKCCRYKAT